MQLFAGIHLCATKLGMRCFILYSFVSGCWLVSVGTFHTTKTWDSAAFDDEIVSTALGCVNIEMGGKLYFLCESRNLICSRFGYVSR